MPDIIRFSDMKNDHPLQLNGANDLLAIAVVSGGTETGYNSMTTTPNQLGQHTVIDQEFANLNTTAKTIQGAINELKDSSSSSHEYSTTEQIVGTWIDGSPVYEKTIYNAGGLSGTVSVAHGITNLSRVISCDASYYDSNAGTSGAIGIAPRIDGNNNIGIRSFGTTNIDVNVPSVFGSRIIDWYFIIRYVKTAT